MRLPCGFERKIIWRVARNAEVLLFAFVPLRGTKDFAQDDSSMVRELMSGCMLQTDPPPASISASPL